MTDLLAIAILFVMGHFLDLWLYVAISFGFQMLVFIFHGLPAKSERFYDISGSMTHCLVIGASLVETQTQKSPRQIFLSMASLIWLVRLGSFLYLRIEKDGKDVRFNDLKSNFLVWTVPWFTQAVWIILLQAPIMIMNKKEDPLSEYQV